MVHSTKPARFSKIIILFLLGSSMQRRSYGHIGPNRDGGRGAVPWNSLHRVSSSTSSSYAESRKWQGKNRGVVHIDVFSTDKDPTLSSTAGSSSRGNNDNIDNVAGMNRLDDGEEDTEEGVTATMKKHNAVGDADSDDDDDDDDDNSDNHTDLDDEDIAALESFSSLKPPISRISTSPPHFDDEDDNRGHVDVDVNTIDYEEEDPIIEQQQFERQQQHQLHILDMDIVDIQTQQHIMEQDSILLHAVQNQIYFPPNAATIASILASQKEDEQFAKKHGLDRRTLYRSLLLEFLGENNSYTTINVTTATTTTTTSSSSSSATKSTTKRKYLDPQTVTRKLTSALSLATQPQWRKFARNISRLSSSNSQRQQYSGSGLKLYASALAEDTTDAMKPPATSAMQETILMALAHSLQCGIVILDDDFFLQVRKSLPEQQQQNIKNGDIIKALFRLYEDKVHLSTSTATAKTSAKLSTLMIHDLNTTWDIADDTSHALQSSLQNQLEFELKHSYNAASSAGHLPLVIFIRAEASSSTHPDTCNKILFQSKTCMDRLVQELKNQNSIHLICLGKECDFDSFSSSSLNAAVADPTSKGGGVDPMESRSRGPNIPSNKQSANTLQLLQAMQNAFAANSGSNVNSGFFPHGPHTSDPEGYQRFNIILARTVDENGNPGIMGAVAPGNVNILPSMVAMMQQKEFQRHQHQNQAGEKPGMPWPPAVGPWGMPMNWQANPLPGMQIPAGVPFFNASIHISGLAMNSNPSGDDNLNNNKWGGDNHPPPEIIQKAMEMAITQVVERLAGGGEVQGNFPPQLQSAYSSLLSNEQTRRELIEKLSKVAPALLNPGCPMVMLSVLCAPASAADRAAQQNNSNMNNLSPSSSNNSRGSWLQKILSAAPSAAGTQGTSPVIDAAGQSTDEDESPKTSHSKTSSNATKTGTTAQQQYDKAHAAFLKRTRNLQKLESLCQMSVPLAVPHDPIKKKMWLGWISRQGNARIYRKNKAALEALLSSSGLQLENEEGSRSLALRAVLGMKDCTEQMHEVVHAAVEIEAERYLRSSSASEANDDNIDVGFDLKSSISSKQFSTKKAQTIKSSSIESALALVCRVSPHSESIGPTEGFGVLAASTKPHPTREDLYQMAADKHERALCNNIIFPENIGVTYDQIGGLDDVKELLRQSITYPLKYPSLYSEGIARESCKGVLLFGPPGTGKTMLAKAVATEGGATFLSVDASSVENKWLGESEKNAKAVFTLARRLAPCVIFLDEVDSLLSSREGTGDDSAHGTLTSVKTTMMSEWDGLNSGTNGAEGAPRVVVIGSTNRPFDLDEAVLRRFPRRILVDLPDLETRKEILEVTLAENRVDSSVNLTSIAERLDGYTGSDIKEVCREAVVRISHEQAKLLDRGIWPSSSRGIYEGEDAMSGEIASSDAPMVSGLQRLRPVTMADFDLAISKLKRSVSEKGKELARVWDWNDEYGEIKRKDRGENMPHLMNMFL